MNPEDMTLSELMSQSHTLADSICMELCYLEWELQTESRWWLSPEREGEFLLVGTVPVPVPVLQDENSYGDGGWWWLHCIMDVLYTETYT